MSVGSKLEGLGCEECGLPALTAAPLAGGKMLGGCAKHQDAVRAAMKRSVARRDNRRQEQVEFARRGQASTSTRRRLDPRGRSY